MNKKALYAVIAVIVVIILVVAVLEVMPSSAASMTVSTSSTNAIAGQSITFAAYISGGTPSKVTFNFGDGTTGTATHLSGNEYTVTHTYSSAGKYLVTAIATVNGKNLNNMQSIDEITVTPSTVNPSLASEITVPSIATSTQIISPGSAISLTALTLQPPTATNWTIGYYIWNFGDGSTHTNYAIFNTSSGTFMADNISHLYNTAGIYVVTLGVITFNATNYSPTTYTTNSINYTYYPVSDLSTILSSGQYQNTTYITTIVVNSTAKLLTTTSIANPNVITNAELVPGGAYSFDPAICYESVGMEIIQNVYETLLAYNGSSTSQSQMIPLVASVVPTVANGGISPDYLNYTFHVRTGLKFSNGDPLNVWDVYISFVRALLFVQGTPGTPDWIIAQDLLPAGGYAPGLYSNGTALFDAITSAVTVNNATQTVTFHLLKPDPAFLDYIADPLGASIMDNNWLVQNGAGITFTPTGFLAYQQYGNEVNYNNYLRYHAMGSGPYMIKSYLIGQFVSLAPNPNYAPIKGVPGYNHTAKDTVNIEWVKDASAELLMLEGGLADIFTGTSDLPTYYYPTISHYESLGKIKVYEFPTLTIYGFEFNFNINTTMLSTLGSGFHIPTNYFTNLDIRRAFAYAFNYTNYINNLVGNARYGANFSSSFVGDIPNGMPGYLSPQQLKDAGVNVPSYNLSIAKEYLEESGMYNVSINIPIIVTAGDPIDFAAVQDWGATLNSIDPNIVISGMYEEFATWLGYQVPNENPMPVYQTIWIPDYPFPSDYIMAFYQENGTYPIGAGFNPTTFSMSGHPNQANQTQKMEQDIATAMSTGNVTIALKYYDYSEEIAVNLTNAVYAQQVNWFWYYSPSLKGVQYEENPLFGGGGDTIYIYLSK
ncbi:MAG: ABC transporter substrate-binding protein [Thermoplasmata archaeon]